MLIPQTIIQAASTIVDPVQMLFGTANSSAYEFDNSSLAGLTAYSPTPDVEDANTTIPGCYYVRDDTTTLAWCGRYITSPATPFTAIIKVTDFNGSVSYNSVAIALGEATPGNVDFFYYGWDSMTIRGDRGTPTTFDSNFAAVSPNNRFATPLWLAIRVNTSSNVDYLWSVNGYIWRKETGARNPGLTLGSIGFAMKNEAASGSVSAAAIDYLRVWSSALSFPGIT